MRVSHWGKVSQQAERKGKGGVGSLEAGAGGGEKYEGETVRGNAGNYLP